MKELINEYQSRRKERIKIFQQEYTLNIRRCDKIAGTFEVQTMHFLSSFPNIIGEIDSDNELRDYAQRQISIGKRKIIGKIKDMQWLIHQKGRKELRAIAEGNVQSLIALSDKIRQGQNRSEDYDGKSTQQLYDDLSPMEKQILFFLEAHNNYRFAQYYGSLNDEETMLKRRSWPFFKIYSEKDPLKRSENNERIKGAIKSLLEKDIILSDKQETDLVKANNDLITRLRETKDALMIMRAKDKESILELLTIIGVEDEEIRERISSHSSYQEIEKCVNSLQSVLSSEEADMIFKSNTNLFLIPKNEFLLYARQLQDTVSKYREQGLEIRVINEPHFYNSIEALNQLEEKMAKKEKDKSRYNDEIATIILDSLKKKMSIGESYIPRAYIRNSVFGKLDEKSKAEEFDKTLDVLIKSSVIIDYSEKGKKNEPISINPHIEEITDPVLREKVRAIL